MKEINHIEIKKGMKVNDLVREMEKVGVMGSFTIGRAADILEKMIKDKDCKVFLGVAGAMIPGGMKKIIIDMLENNYVDVFVTTGATLTHDLVEALGHKHYQGSEFDNDSELNKKGIVRMFNSFMKNEVYQDLEDFCKRIFKNMKKEMNIKEFLWEIGKNLNAEKDSILKTCFKKKIPIFCPAIADSGLGLQVWNFIQENKLNVDAFQDLKEILDIAWTSKKTGIFYIGGGTPKNYIQQAMQFSKAAIYGIQITTDREEFGGSSGASLKEGISWGKLEPNADFIDVRCDATIALPLIYAAVKDRINE